MISRASGGSVTSTVSTPAALDAGSSEVGCGRENMSLNTGEARERTSLWTRKSRLGGPRALRMISPSGKSTFSSFHILMVRRREGLKGGGGVK